MNRFLAVALPGVLLVLAAVAFVRDLGLPRSRAFPETPLSLVEWALEACAVTALFLLAHREERPWWLEGFLIGGIAWVFRGPLVLLATVRLAPAVRPSPVQPFVWLVGDLAAGLLLAGLARGLDRGDDEGPGDPPP